MRGDEGLTGPLVGMDVTAEIVQAALNNGPEQSAFR